MARRQQPSPRVWALLGARAGDNNQVLVLARALGYPFEVKQLRYNALRHLQPPLLGATLRSLKRGSRELASAAPPDLTISAGHRSVPVVQALRAASKGAMRSVHIGYPRVSPGKFDLVVATPEYPMAEHANLLRIPIALTAAAGATCDSAFWADFPAPRHLLIIGGPTMYWHVRATDIRQALEEASDLARKRGGSLIVVASPRTPPALLKLVDDWVARADLPALLAPRTGPPSYGELLSQADEIMVTADSTAMISDAIAAGKPVTLVPIRPTIGGRIALRLNDLLFPGRAIYPRDLRRLWRELERQDLVGTGNSPKVPNVIEQVVERVTAILAW